MEHTGHQWPQGVGFVNNSGIEKLTRESNDTGNNQNKAKKMTRPGKDQAVSCPRCNSLNTKFCYYNNYSLSQPRHFCKNCRRYWTQGGSLRNVPVGGGSRKNKRPSSSSSIPPPPAASSASENYMKLFPPITFPNHQSPRLVALGEARDLNLSYPEIPSSAPTIGTGSTNANAAYKGLSSMMMSSNFVQDLAFSSGGYHGTMPEFKPATISSSSFLDFSLAHNVSDTNTGGFDLGSHGNFQLGPQEGGGEARDLFPVGDPKQAMPSDNRAIDDHQQFEQKKGILGGGGEVDSSGTGFWNQGLLVGSSISWINGNQIH